MEAENDESLVLRRAVPLRKGIFRVTERTVSDQVGKVLLSRWLNGGQSGKRGIAPKDFPSTQIKKVMNRGKEKKRGEVKLVLKRRCMPSRGA
ncbi:hypothetical protein KCU64_g75, partial [Aureobasidium melanogenum]